MKILFIGPLPPPITGQSHVDQVLLNELVIHHNIIIVDTNKSSFVSGIDSSKRIFQILNILKIVWSNRNNNDSIYLTISESIAGNIRDILIYFICFKNLHKIVIHLHGGSFKRDVIDKSRMLKLVNKFFIKRFKAIIILGKSHLNIFSEFVEEQRISIIPNFASESLFIDKRIVLKKFAKTNPLKILFISNLIEGKGYMELIDAYLGLDAISKQKIILHIGGAADPEHIKKTKFLERISIEENIHYHGFINEEKKKNLLAEAHILCFPSYLLEGQGVVVLEAYASGCVVITTGSGGIKDVFEDGINGYRIETKSAISIQKTIEKIIRGPEKLLSIALKNRTIASEEYRIKKFTTKVMNILEK
jgi:glycosyltransferase involved in cell wall biosynthesis